MGPALSIIYVSYNAHGGFILLVKNNKRTKVEVFCKPILIFPYIKMRYLTGNKHMYRRNCHNVKFLVHGLFRYQLIILPLIYPLSTAFPLYVWNDIPIFTFSYDFIFNLF